MQTSTFFTEKPKSREDQIADEDELLKFQERIEDLEDNEGDYPIEDNFYGMNDYYANSEGW